MFTCKVFLFQVIIISHIPPGVLPVVWDSFQEAYNKRYTELLLGYADTIKTQIYGHEHRDSIRLFYDSNGKLNSEGLSSYSQKQRDVKVA